MLKILIVEDDEIIREELAILLKNNGYEAEYLTNFDDAVDSIMIRKPDLIILDVNLPNISGLTICDLIRSKSNIPIIFVTGNRTSMDELNCIIRGGDDYIAKPYQAPILLARIAAVLKRTGGNDGSNYAYGSGKENTSDSRIQCGIVTLDIASATIFSGEKKTELTKNEMKILYYLMKNQGKFVSRTELIDYLWDNEVFIDDNTLSVNITRIRSKLESIEVFEYIETKRKMGYRV